MLTAVTGGVCVCICTSATCTRNKAQDFQQLREYPSYPNTFAITSWLIQLSYALLWALAAYTVPVFYRISNSNEAITCSLAISQTAFSPEAHTAAPSLLKMGQDKDTLQC